MTSPRRFVTLAGRAWRNKGKAAAVAFRAIPAGVRMPVADGLAGGAERLARRLPGSRRIASAAFLARTFGRRAGSARAVALRLGTRPGAAPATSAHLARLAYDAGFRAEAAQIVAALPADAGGEAELVRARLGLDAGTYGDALRAAQRAEAANVGGAAHLVKQLESRLLVLSAGWVPDLGSDAARLTRLRGGMRRGTILHLLYASLPYHHAGFSVRSQSVAQCQRAAGLDPVMATRAGFPRSQGIRGVAAVEEVDGVAYHRLAPDYQSGGMQDRLLDATARAAITLIEASRPAAIHAASNHVQGQVALALARPLGVPMIYEARGFWEETWAAHPERGAAAAEADHYRLSRDAETSVMRAADAVVTLSETMRAEIVSRGVPEDHVVVVPNAVDVERFVPQERDAALAASLGIAADDPVVGYVSSFNAYEGIRYLVEAVATLRAAGRRVRLLLVGDGPDEADIRATAKRLGLDDGTLVMPGRVAHEDVARYHALIDVFVVPRTEDRVSRLVTPLKPFEAMAMERAVVVSDVPALRELVEPGVTGLTFKAEDAAALAGVLAALLDDPTRREELGRQARAWVLDERTWAANGRRYRELYERLGAA